MPTLDDPVAFSLGPLTIRWYALFLLLGIIVGVAIVRALARRRGLDDEFPLDAAPWVIGAAIVGARLYYLVLRQDYYRANPGEAVGWQLRGLTIHGALVGGILMFTWLCRRRGEPFLTWADLVIAAAPFGQAIGRWGNWANQEAFGSPTDLPWAVTIDPARRPAGYRANTTFHPTFLYEAGLNLLIGGVLVWVVLRMRRRSWFRPGDALWLYFIGYGIARLLVERVRTDSLTIGPWPAAYWLSVAFILFGAAMLVLRHRHETTPFGDVADDKTLDPHTTTLMRKKSE